jgi:adenylate kinase family enzyme
MTRVAVIGNAGGGKSTLCRRLSAASGLPYFAVDQMQWRPGWKTRPAEEFAVAHGALLERPAWIIDGFGPWPEVEKRLDVADTIIFVDLPLWRHYWWATKRQVVGRSDGPEGCPMWPMTFQLYRMMWRLDRDVRPELVASIKRRSDTARIFHLRSPEEIEAFLVEASGTGKG